ncbi:aspartyl-phosphate phosphatase Spo0E family protein [Biomaibacter acetigenes]|uniref:aspartyl-phosphate phosphatase Spo0E family protein n=1 Tax=Biomaibacter acetigenes TaxID=2316383 RepID=UPI001CA3D6FD|nr:aspartyl-phosphate phosphatase Spo0E family protein [Biomaibacter acetigenes]
MDGKDKIEIARNILNNAANMNMSKEILLKISQKIDKYIVEYFRKGGGQKGSSIRGVTFSKNLHKFIIYFAYFYLKIKPKK